MAVDETYTEQNKYKESKLRLIVIVLGSFWLNFSSYEESKLRLIVTVIVLGSFWLNFSSYGLTQSLCLYNCWMYLAALNMKLHGYSQYSAGFCWRQVIYIYIILLV